MTDFLNSLNISGSGLTAQRARMDIIAQNIANSEVTRTETGGPYRRQVVVLKSTGDHPNFKDVLEAAEHGVTINSARNFVRGGGRVYTDGVKVDRIIEDQTPFVPVYDPEHPDANEDGYVMYPNVDRTQEIIDMMGASRAYQANITAFNAVKEMLQKAMDMRI